MLGRSPSIWLFVGFSAVPCYKSNIMSANDIRSCKLGFFARIRVRMGKCPNCGSTLQKDLLPELVDSWTYGMSKYTARTLGNRSAPSSNVTEIPACLHCEPCKRWYSGAWEYWKTS